ncbi:MAG: glycosyl transferase family 51 [Actinobacteria bacterium]|nr:glycosyl transferase family 51 [Actinomycetota bacterium]MSW36585.1 glycosyl transferase family 51 [Actinomycetota bacterium]MSX37970.1 glycosyl transferase family 51 [Actinomycetota bacterium]
MSAPLGPPASTRAPTRPSSAHAGMTATLVKLVLFVIVSAVAGGLVALGALPFVGGVGVAARTAIESYESLPSQLTTPPLPQRSRILAADGSVIATLYEQNRVEVPLSEIAPVMRQAIVAVEDGRFYEHRGIDVRGLLRAVVGNAGGSSVTQGGSTLTQQYVKNVFVNSAATPDEAAAARARSMTRKLKEMRYALALERQFSKDEILERYLNIAYFGAGAYGVEAASRRYFSKSASTLTLVEAATLAGAVQQPVAYDPTRNPKSSQNRRAQVLGRMADLGDITVAEAKIASAIPTATFLKPLKARNGCTTSYAPFFCDYVDRILRSDPAFGATPAIREALLRRGGLTVRTTLSPAAQKAAQASVDGHIPRADPSRKVAAITMVRPGTGEVVAMAQNRSWGTSGLGNTTYNFNVGIKDGGSQGAQAGSTFKAFTLAAALEKGISPYEAIPSPQKGIFDGFANCTDGSLFPPYTVNNSTGAGIFNMFEGAAYSINTYFMALEQRTGLCRPAEIAEALGLRRGDGSPLERVPSFTLGTQEVTPLGMAATYGVIANHGMRCSTIAIAQVTDRDGKDLPIPRTTCERVLDRVVADSVAKILSQVVDGPLPGRTGKAMSLGRPAAGKTGTINDSAAVWFVGFTPDLAAAVATYDPRGGYRFPMKNITIGGRYFAQVFGSTLPGPIWKEAMLGALAASQPALFELLTPESFLAPLPTPSVSPSPSASGSPSPSGSPSASPTPSGSPSPSPTPGPSITPTPTPTPTVPQ